MPSVLTVPLSNEQKEAIVLKSVLDLARSAWQPTPVLLPGESHGQRSLVGYNLWGHKEPDTQIMHAN